MDSRLLFPAVAVAAYLWGSVPSAYLVVKLKNAADLRQQGTGNIGALNAGRAIGWQGFLAVALLDIMKGALPLWILARWSPRLLVLEVAALALVLGHCYSVYLKGQGGRGLASAVGVLGYLSPLTLAGVVAVAAVSFAVTRKHHLSASLAALAIPLMGAVLGHGEVTAPFTIALAAVILSRHIRVLSAYFR